jgi:transposase
MIKMALPVETKISQKREVVFKRYEQGQMINIPVALEQLVPSGHLSRIVDHVVERIEMENLRVYYSGGGSSPYDPKMMLKVWIYGYCERIYTSRRLAKAMREHVVFMWLSGAQTPCFKTLSAFRSERMQQMVDTVAKQVLLLLVERGYVDPQDLYVDGSKWEANANRHKVTWAKNTERHKSTVIGRIDALLEQSRALQQEEDRHYGNRDLAEVGAEKQLKIELDSTQVRQHLQELNALIEAKAEEKVQEKKALGQIKKKLTEEVQKLEKYEGQEQILQGRNSYSKTDSDAIAMRMKDGRLLPGYNIQHTTTNQYIANWTVEQGASDSPTLEAHVAKLKERLQGLPVDFKGHNLCADAGYGSEENYAMLESMGMGAYVKYPLFDQEQSGELQKKRFRAENFPYDPKSDTFRCPQERKLHFVETFEVVTKNGYRKQMRRYQCESCEGCPMAAECKKSEIKARSVGISVQGEAYKQKAQELLNSKKGIEMRKQRGVEVEGTFGDIKYNMQHRRFSLRGKKKVYVEYGLLAIGHNLRKVYCQESGCWADTYAQRANKKAKKAA